MQVLKHADDLRCIESALFQFLMKRQGNSFWREKGKLQRLIVLKFAFVTQIREKLSSLNVFEDEIEEALVLGEADHFNLEGVNEVKQKLTRKGWLMLERMVFSEIIWSTCFNLKISAFFSIFRATNSLVALFLASRTLPKEPVWTVFNEIRRKRERTGPERLKDFEVGKLDFGSRKGLHWKPESILIWNEIKEFGKTKINYKDFIFI